MLGALSSGRGWKIVALADQGAMLGPTKAQRGCTPDVGDGGQGFGVVRSARLSSCMFLLSSCEVTRRPQHGEKFTSTAVGFVLSC